MEVDAKFRQIAGALALKVGAGADAPSGSHEWGVRRNAKTCRFYTSGAAVQPESTIGGDSWAQTTNRRKRKKKKVRKTKER